MTTREKVRSGAQARIVPWDAKWSRRASMTRGWKKGVGSCVRTSVLVRVESSVGVGDVSMRPGIGESLLE